MGAPVSEAEFRFIEPGGYDWVAQRNAVVGDTIRFQVYPGCRPGGPLPPFLSDYNVNAITALVCRVSQSFFGFVLEHIRVTWDAFGAPSEHVLPFYILLRTDDPEGVLRVNPSWSNPNGAEFTLTAIDFWQARKQGSASIIAELVMPGGGAPPVSASAALPVTVEPFPLHLALPSTKFVKVGSTIGPALSCPLPFGESFSTEAGGFWSDLIIADDLRSLTLRNLTRPPAVIGDILKKFDLRLSVEPEADGWTGVFFQPPEPAAVDVLGPTRFESFTNFIVGRKSGSVQVFCDITVRDPDVFSAPDGRVSFTVVVQPQTLTIDFEAGGGGSEILIEDDWRADEETLRGTMLVRVRREGAVIFASSGRSIVQGGYTETTLNILRIDRAYDDGAEHATDRFLTSVQLRLSLPDANNVVFNVSGTSVGSSYAIQSSVWDWLAARQHTPAGAPVTLECRIVEADLTRPADYSPDFVVYTAGPAKTVSVTIPPPLTATLVKWADAHYDNLPLGLGDPSDELIYSSGTLTAQVANHRSQSTTEQLKLIVTPPGLPAIETPLDPDEDIAASGQVQVPVAGLDYSDATGGDNQITLWAWKPINDVEGVAGDQATVTLTCVPPRDYEILEPADGITIRRARLNNVRYRLARSVRANVADVPFVEYSDDREAFDLETRETGPIELETTAGDKTLMLRAINDFDFLDDTITIHAPRPTIQATVNFPPDLFRAPNEVGHTVTSVGAAVTITNGRRLQIVRGGTVLRDTALDESLPTVTQQIQLPPAGSLADGDNQFELIAVNDFGSRSVLVNIRRRGQVFDGTATFTIETVDQTVDGHPVIIELRFIVEGATQPLVTGAGIVSFDLSGPSDDAFLGWEHFDFQTFIETNNGRESVSVNAIRRVGAVIIGPDFQNTTILIAPEPGWVIASGEQNESPIPGLFSTVTLSTEAVTASGAEQVTYVAVNIDTLQLIDEDGTPA